MSKITGNVRDFLGIPAFLPILISTQSYPEVAQGSLINPEDKTIYPSMVGDDETDGDFEVTLVMGDYKFAIGRAVFIVSVPDDGNTYPATERIVSQVVQTPTSPTGTVGATYSVVPYAASLVVDFNGTNFQMVTLAGNLTLSSTNRAAPSPVKLITLILTGDGSDRTLAFPAGWIFLGSKPTSLVAGKKAALSLTCFGTAESDVVAAYGYQA